MGNEAIARGAIEDGVHVAVGYPGTPSTEVIENLTRQATETGMHVEWAVNEKVAIDIGAGVSYGGARSLVTMKSAGLNVASDSLISIAYGDLVGVLSSMLPMILGFMPVWRKKIAACSQPSAYCPCWI
jgi:indolepyruvate ferredoxin oxidoreductase alpha subunit